MAINFIQGQNLFYRLGLEYHPFLRYTNPRITLIIAEFTIQEFFTCFRLINLGLT